MKDKCSLCMGSSVQELDPKFNDDGYTHVCKDCGEAMVRSEAGGLIYYLPIKCELIYYLT